ncbi:hypothetical protein D3C75_158670 [compost metagenome]
MVDHGAPTSMAYKKKPKAVTEESDKTLLQLLKDPEPEYRKPTPVGRFGIMPMGYKNRGFNRFIYTWVITDRWRYYRGSSKTKPVPMSAYAKELFEGTFAKWKD